jgi:hypothetical protein
MPRVTIDTSEAVSFEPVEPGAYPMSISTAEVKNSKETNTPMLNIGFAFEDPDTAKKAGKVFRNFMLAGKGSGFTRDFLKAAAGIEIPAGAAIDFDTDDIVGRHVIAQIGNREYQGQMQNEVERIISAG